VDEPGLLAPAASKLSLPKFCWNLFCDAGLSDASPAGELLDCIAPEALAGLFCTEDE
jgi:hypothetical protein